MALVYIVEDDGNIREIETFALKNAGYEIRDFECAKDFYKEMEKQKPDMILLDIMLPDEDGLEIVRKLRAMGETRGIPVIMVTAKASEIDKVKGLDIGADDYMTKPFRPLELIARVKAQLRRYKKYNMPALPEDSHIITHGGLMLNSLTHECTLDEKNLSLTPTEFTILYVLCQKKGQVISAEELFHAVWGEEYFSKSNNTITVHIRHLREKMNDSFEDPKYIKTVWGCGYKIES